MRNLHLWILESLLSEIKLICIVRSLASCEEGQPDGKTEVGFYRLLVGGCCGLRTTNS